MKKQALISVSDKTNSIELAQFLIKNNYTIISTGGTYSHLKTHGIDVIDVESVTNQPEILEGRVKTLHPKIHGGILAKRNKTTHLAQLKEQNIQTIDLVVVNLYPFFENADKNLSEEDLVEFIDIGGPTMLRAAAKSYHDVTVISHIEDYDSLIYEITENNTPSYLFRKRMAAKVFQLTAAYDSAIAQKLEWEPELPLYFTSSYKKITDLRYGENPHQKAAFYTSSIGEGAMKDFVQHQGKELSFNNIRDMDLAWKVANEFEETTCCAVKHSTPCGVAIDSDIETAYQKAHDCDPISIFGGIVAFNKKVTGKLQKN